MLSVYYFVEDIKRGLISKPIIIEAVKENFKTKEAIKDLTASLWVAAAANDGQIQNNLSSAAQIIEKHFNIETFSIGNTMSPEWAQTDNAKSIFAELVEAGFCVDVGGVYRWNGSLDLWGFFADIVSEKLNLKKNKGDKFVMDWVLIASAFENISKDDIDTIKVSRCNTKAEYKNYPNRWKDIEKIVNNK